MVFRIALYTSHTTVGFSTKWFLPGLLYLLASLTFAGLRPYRNDIFNVIDSLLFALANVGTFSQSLVAAGGVGSTRPYQIFVQLAVPIPLVYMSCYVVYRYVLTPLYRRAKRRRLETSMDNTSNIENDFEDFPHQLSEELLIDSQLYRWHSDTTDSRSTVT